MVDNRELCVGNHYEEIDNIARDLAVVLQEQGLQEALKKAEEQATTLNRDSNYLMHEAVGILFRSGDPVKQEHGLGFLAWEAEHLPSTTSGNDIAYDARYDAQQEEHREFAGRCFEVSLMHFRFVAKAEGFVPTASYFEDFNAATSRMQEEDYPELFDGAIREFAPVAILAATIYEPKSDTEGTDYDKATIDQALAIVASVLRKSHPEISEQAMRLITDDQWKTFSVAEKTDDAFTDAMLASNFTKAKEIMADLNLTQGLWHSMTKRLVTEEGSDEWGNAVIDTILTVKPDYFSKYGLVKAADLFIGRQAGQVIGLLGRKDVIDMILIPQEYKYTAMMTAMGIAQGLGVRGNLEGLAHLFNRTPHYTEEIKKAVQTNFDIGFQVA